MLTNDEIRKRGKRLPKSKFDKLCREKKIKNAQISTFGDGYGDPYIPTRLIFGCLNKELVWTESNDRT